MSSAPVVLSAGLNDRWRRMQLNKTTRNKKKTKTGTPFPKWNIDMTMQSPVLSMQALISLLYML